jgi:FkbM family methyltransferase
MNVTDSIAFLSRRLAHSGNRKVAAALFRYYPVKNGATTIHDFDGDLRMNIDRQSYISSAIYWSGHHSPEIHRYIADFLNPDMVMADIGANIGEITLAAKRTPRGRVLAFEPSPQLFEQLSRNVALNHFPSVSLFNFGLFDSVGELPFYLRSDNPYGTHNDGVSSLFPNGHSRQQISVPLRRFDDVALECRLTRLDLIKIDVEGAELMVLRGCENALREFRPIVIVEVEEPNFKAAGYSRADLFAWLRYLNYAAPVGGDAENVPACCDVVCFPLELGEPMQILAAG